MEHLVRDPVHHTIQISTDERRVIDNPLFQRLRRIKQTAFLNYVFPGATHDRFSHSIGAMHMAGLVFDQIAHEFASTFSLKAFQPNQQDYFRRVVRLAALLHDVGHGPFSHSLEGVTSAGKPIHPIRKDFLELSDIPAHWIDPRGSANKDSWLSKPAHHEEFSIAIIARMSDEHGRIAGLLAQDVAALIVDWIAPTDEFESMDRVGPSGRWSLKSALKSLVSGEVDADRMDYLLRDSHYTGVPYGNYDKEMLVGNMIWRPHPEAPNTLCVALRRKALHAFEDFLISRFHMFLQLYSHKTTVGFDVILENALAELPDFAIDPTLDDYVNWSDDWLLRRILENRSSRWGQHIADRLTLKHLFTVSQEDKSTFLKFIKPFERSRGTTAWFPSLTTKTPKNSQNKKRDDDVPKLWWRESTAFLTHGERGEYPVYLEDRGRMVAVEEVSILLKSDYVRRMDQIHVYCLREDYQKATTWLTDKGLPAHIFKIRRALVGI
jgi:HD superfamily phosphohydrolase